MAKKKRKTKQKIGIVICTLNEEKTIAGLVKESFKYAGEVCIVDGHSTDETVLRAEKAGAVILFEDDKGKGGAIRTAIRRKDYDIFVFMDADRSHDPGDIPLLLSPILKGKADCVVGSRLLGGSDELHGSFDEFLRLLGGALITFCINWRLNVRITDCENGFRAARGKMLKALDLRENQATIEQEMVIKTIKKGFTLTEVPTHEYRRKYGGSKISITRQGFRFVYSMIKYLLLP